ncbi:photosynthesis system II assembly factor YCF48-like protein [Panacagrimonas perspica]|uniref:Photosynthesis system II assembly factor YCF48-like protein n=3 Tax=Panacagrimonas perspica TaxID=381431 RepID=A0A4R7NZN8_9GAMM|nr:photosynthesis system II assembly factor YCF48-like protein [Panacagrimonas perspica]
MMRRLMGAMLGLAMATASSAAEAPAKSGGVLKTIIEGIPHSALFGLSLDSNSGSAVGAGGSIYETTDGGVTWKAVDKAPTTLAFLSVSRRGDKGIAVGQAGVVAVRDGSGWKISDSGVPARLLSVEMNSSGLAFAGGEFGTLLKSSDFGASWSSAAPDWASMASAEHFGTGEPMIYAVSVLDSGQITVAGEFGVMLRSNDAGATWRVLRPINPEAATLHALHLSPSGQNSYAVGQTGEMLISTDGGETWGKCDIATELNFLGVAASASGQVVVTGMRVMYRSENNGMTWTQIEEGDTKTDWYQAVRTETGSGRILAVGHAGKIIQIGG